MTWVKINKRQQETENHISLTGTALQAERSRFRFPMVSLEFFIDIILLAALWTWGWFSL